MAKTPGKKNTSNDATKLEATKPETGDAAGADNGMVVRPQIQYRDQMAQDHHLFKGMIAIALRSDKWGPIKVKTIEHVHFFHSVSSDGDIQKHSNAVCGHVHEWSWSVNPKTGRLEATCGPPLKKVQRPGPNGMTRTTYERIKVKNVDTNEVIPDNHIHEMEYQGSDRLTAAFVKQIRESNSAQIGKVAVKVHEDPKMPEGYAMGDADRKETVE